MKLTAMLATVGLMLCGFAQGASAQTTGGVLKQIKDRGNVNCGVSTGVPGFSQPDDSGEWKGVDADICRALAAAVFDDPKKVRFVPLSSKDRLIALQSGAIDVLSRTTTWSLGRDIGQGISFTTVSYYDGQGFLVRKGAGIKSVKELDGATICVGQGSTNEMNVADYFSANKLSYKIVALADVSEVVSTYESGRCDAYSHDMSQLAANRFLMKDPTDHVILPEVISKEPLGPWVRKGDAEWFDIVRWTVYAMITAEELGITQATVDKAKAEGNSEAKRLLGAEGNFGEAMGLTSDWAYRIVRHVGNYGESFERNLGSGSRIGLIRSVNSLWNNGGLLYSPPFR